MCPVQVVDIVLLFWKFKPQRTSIKWFIFSSEYVTFLKNFFFEDNPKKPVRLSDRGVWARVVGWICLQIYSELMEADSCLTVLQSDVVLGEKGWGRNVKRSLICSCIAAKRERVSFFLFCLFVSLKSCTLDNHRTSNIYFISLSGNLVIISAYCKLYINNLMVCI